MRWMALLGMAALACQSGSRTPPAAKDAGAAPVDMPQRRVVRTELTTLPEPPVELPRQESFRLLAPGAAPRTALRYRWKGASRDLDVTAEARVRSRELTGTAWSPAKDMPPLRESFAMTVAPGDDGRAALLLRGLPGGDAGNPLTARWKALVENRRAQTSIDDRGQLGKITLAEDPTGGNPTTLSTVDEIVQRLLSGVVPLPEQPVGKGARWKVVTVLRAGDAVIKQTAEYTLVAARRDGWDVDVVSKRVAEQQTMMPANLPKGTLAELVAMFRELRGRLTVRADAPWPNGKLDAELRVHGRLAVPGRPIVEHMTEDLGTLELIGTDRK